MQIYDLFTTFSAHKESLQTSKNTQKLMNDKRLIEIFFERKMFSWTEKFVWSNCRRHHADKVFSVSNQIF